MRTAAIVIDNFLPLNKWNQIQNNISSYLHVSNFVEERGELYTQCIRWIKEELKNKTLWIDHWDQTIDMWSYLNSLPINVDRESSGENGGYHSEFGGFVYYIHPSWNSSWGGHLKFKDCDVEKIEPKPNRFVWINPAVLHGIEIVNSNAKHNRITIVGWPEGCLEYGSASIKINTK